MTRHLRSSSKTIFYIEKEALIFPPEGKEGRKEGAAVIVPAILDVAAQGHKPLVSAHLAKTRCSIRSLPSP